MHKDQVVIPLIGDPQTNKVYQDIELQRALFNQLSLLLLQQKKKTVGSRYMEQKFRQITKQAPAEAS